MKYIAPLFLLLASAHPQEFRPPNVDQMAPEGTRFTQYYAGNTVCAPSRCVLMTGLHSGHCFIRGNAKANLRPEDVTVAKVLKGAGYSTGIAGKWGNPFFLRFDHEMTGWWYPWGEQVNGNQPGDFVAAWQHVHDIFVQQGATNATWVWCPNAVGKSTTALAEVYPGDDYVDWTCLDSYNFGTDGGNLWISFKEAFNGSIAYGTRDSYSQLVNLAPTKPIMIGETASSENGGSKAAWITDMLEAELPNQFPQVKALVWFDSSGIEWGRTFPLDSSPAATRAFQSGIASPVYASNAYATLEVSPIPAPEYLVPKP